MNKIKIALTTILVVLILSISGLSQEHRRERANREPKIAQRAPERHYGASQRRFEHRDFHRRPRIVILPRLVFRFPSYHRGYRVYSVSQIGYRDGFIRGREDFRLGICDPNFEWDYRNGQSDEYQDGFLKGYRDGCGMRSEIRNNERQPKAMMNTRYFAAQQDKAV